MARQTFRKTSRLYWIFLTTALIVSGNFRLISPVLADTQAGQEIKNTATATYIDLTDPLNIINATSDTITVTVAEVSGITATNAGVIDDNGGKIARNDQIFYDYTITNVGNDPTQLFIPDQDSINITGPGTITSVDVDLDGDGTFETSVPANGLTTTTAIAADGSIKVRVTVSVDSNANSGETIGVRLGNAANNDGTSQSLVDAGDGSDLQTIDDSTPAPANGESETSVLQEATVEASPTALAKVLKTQTNHDKGDPLNIIDDVLTYDLSLQVESSDPTGIGLNPAPLAGIDINVDGVVKAHILISDAIPAGTELQGTPVAPSGWITVYTDSFIATAAVDANWRTDIGDLTGPVTRVGFINSTVATVTPGQTVNGFSLQLGVIATATSPLNVANIVQAFGATDGVPDILVYDESGDQNPNNYNPANGTVDVFDPITDTGLLDATDLAALTASIGIDTNNDNTGDGPGGEANFIEIALPAVGDILNGPKDVVDAIGPTDSNDDFTNKSTPIIKYTKPGSTIDPDPVTFVNTFVNQSGQSADVTLEPVAPVNPLDLPDQTVVTITAADILDPTNPIKSATYQYVQATGTFTLTNGVAIVFDNSLPLVGGPGKGVLPNVPVAYNVEIDLPTNTPLSTDTIEDYTGDTEFGFPVQVVAKLDTDGDGTFEAENTTIDRLYTGYLKLEKTFQVLQGDGPIVSDPDNPPAPGNIIEYTVTYSNISTPGGGVGNIGLNASTVIITEDGADVAIDNNWALDNDSNGETDTSHVVGQASDDNGGVVAYFDLGGGSVLDAVGVDITKYIDTISNVAPGVSGEFSFQRKVN
ncbi:MAG: hypothetical protein WBG70_04765 [Spirulinaceae cyanobacterium]